MELAERYSGPVSQPALQLHIARVHPIRTPAPATRPSVSEQRRRELNETDARVELGFGLLAMDAVKLTGRDDCFAARARALMLDLDHSMELLQSLSLTSVAYQAELYARGPAVAERRLAVRRWMRIAAA
jgi:hypothetical protein